MKSPFAVTGEECLTQLKSRAGGLTQQEVWERLNRYGPNELAAGGLPG